MNLPQSQCSLYPSIDKSTCKIASLFYVLYNDLFTLHILIIPNTFKKCFLPPVQQGKLMTTLPIIIFC